MRGLKISSIAILNLTRIKDYLLTSMYEPTNKRFKILKYTYRHNTLNQWGRRPPIVQIVPL